MTLLMFGCSKSNNIDYKEPIQTTITGVVLNRDPLRDEIEITIDKLGLSKESLIAKLDSSGNFSLHFKTYLPTDLWINYRTSFLILAHPGDSVHVVFDGSFEKRAEVLNTVQFSGNESKMNQDAATLQKMYYSSKSSNNWDRKQTIIKDYDSFKYLEYLKENKNDKLFKKFVKEVRPNKETKIWAKIFLDSDYYSDLAIYPFLHQKFNNLPPDQLNVPLSYYDNFKKLLPIKKEMLISSNAISSYVNSFHAIYVFEHLLRDKANSKYVKKGRIISNEKETEILQIQSVLRYVEDDLLKQMVLTELFSQSLETNGKELVENNSDIISKYIKEPFLLEPLLQKYDKVKKWNQNPQLASNAIFKNIENTSANEIMGNIIQSNKGKIVYIDCWGTWCGACIKEFPESKKLMSEMKDKNVSFVYVCFNSTETGWKAVLSEHQLEGQQYLLSSKQSVELKNALEINGFPFYIIIDQNGVIAEKGSHLIPSEAKNKIKELLKK